MPQRQSSVASVLDVGRHSFGAFLDDHFDKVKHDLLRECERITVARELLLKKKLHDTQKQNEQLHAKLMDITNMAADGALQLNGSQVAESNINQSAPQDTAQQIISDLVPSPDASDLDISVLPQISLEEDNLTLSNDHHAKSETFMRWAEWKDAAEKSSGVAQQMDELTQDGDQIKEWDRGVANEIKNSKRSPCSVSPNAHSFICWEVVGIPILFYDLVMIPMQVFHKARGVLFDVIYWMLLLYWTTDLLLRLLVVGHVTKDGIVKLERKVFMKMYLRTAFAFDFLMVASDWFSLTVGAGMRNVGMLRLLRFLRLMRLLRMSKMKRLFRDVEDMIDSEYFTVLVSIWVNLLAILGMCHYLACFWFWVGNIELSGEQSWAKEHLQGASWQYQYVVSLHWAMAQFTPGASRIQPYNILEAGASILTLVIGLIFLAMFVSALSQARMRLLAMTSKVDRDNLMLRRYLRQHGVSMDLQVRAKRYVERCVEPMATRVQRKDVYLLPLLSRPLQLEVQEEQYFQTLVAHPLLGSLRQRSMSLILHLFLSVIIEIYLADGDLLFEFGSVAHEMYIVSKGVLMYLHHGSKQLDAVDVGVWFSEAVLWVQWVHKGSAKAGVESQVISIDSAKFRSAVFDHKELSYTSRCANAYFKDLNALAHKGTVITDLIRISDDSSSAYAEAICGKSINNTISL